MNEYEAFSLGLRRMSYKEAGMIKYGINEDTLTPYWHTMEGGIGGSVEEEQNMENKLKDGIGQEMIRYKCHKEVYALKILSITLKPTLKDEEDDGSRIITPVDSNYTPFLVDNAYVRKHNPQEGGYYVVYDDGYISFLPAKAFEEGYT